MEALTAVSCALLTVYDMCKSRDRGMRIGDIRLLRKEGGQSGIWDAADPAAGEEGAERAGRDTEPSRDQEGGAESEMAR